MNTGLLLPVLLSLIFSAFFSGIEIAYLSANKLHIELKGKQGSLSDRIFAYFSRKTSLFIGTTLVGNTISLVLYGIFMAQLIEPVLQQYLVAPFANAASIMVVQTLVSTMLVLFTAEFLPKSLFMINPNQMLTVFAIPFLVMYILLFPVVYFIVTLSRLMIVYVLRVEYSESKPAFGLTDLNNYLTSTLNVKHEDEDIALDKKIFRNALDFKTVRVRECMIPRTEMVALDVSEGIARLRETFVESGHSKIVIYKDTIDDVIGYCHSSELFRRPARIEDILTPMILVPETTLANELLIQFVNHRKSLAVVVDEFGGTSGIVSMEDIIEEIFGEIEDEHDEQNEFTEQQLDDHTFLMSGRLEIDYINDRYSWNLPEGDYETLAGLILAHTGDLPQAGESVRIDACLLTVETILDNRIDTVRVVLTDLA